MSVISSRELRRNVELKETSLRMLTKRARLLGRALYVSETSAVGMLFPEGEPAPQSARRVSLGVTAVRRAHTHIGYPRHSLRVPYSAVCPHVARAVTAVAPHFSLKRCSKCIAQRFSVAVRLRLALTRLVGKGSRLPLRAGALKALPSTPRFAPTATYVRQGNNKSLFKVAPQDSQG